MDILHIFEMLILCFWDLQQNKRQNLILKSHNSKITEAPDNEVEPKLADMGQKVSMSRSCIIMWKLKVTTSTEHRPRQ